MFFSVVPTVVFFLLAVRGLPGGYVLVSMDLSMFCQLVCVSHMGFTTSYTTKGRFATRNQQHIRCGFLHMENRMEAITLNMF